MSEPQPTKIGKYEILSTLGRGGMGVVYKARDPIIDRVVAIKTIIVGGDTAGDESLVERLHMEARSAGRLHHSNIVTVFDFGQQDELSYIVMEFVEGVNLARLIDERRPLTLESKLRILMQIADGLGYAHEHNVVHRDMKPSNVCVTAKGVAKILDFGLARFDDTKLTKTGFLAGTIGYMSPERLSGETGMKDDIFALGAIAYELVTYERAFPGSSAPQVISKIISPELPPNPSTLAPVPPELDGVIQKALAKDVADRYENASAFAAALHEFVRSTAMRDYGLDSQRPTLDRPREPFIDERPSASAYVGPSSGKQPAEPPPTMVIRDNEAPTQIEVAPTAGWKAGSTQADVAINQTPAAPTQIIRSAGRRPPYPAIAVAIAIIIAVGVLLMRKPAAVPALPKPVTQLAPAGADAAEAAELQLATARSMSEQLAGRHLTADEMMRFRDAKARLSLAEKKLQAKDYTAGARLIGDSMSALRLVMTSSNNRMQEPAVQKDIPKKPSGSDVSVSAAITKRPPPVAAATKPASPPIVTATPPPVIQTAPAPQPQPPSQPAQKTVAAESPEKQIPAFMKQLAAAYQAKDIGFFRDHMIHFTDQLEKAIRNSPSVRVELQITSIDSKDAQHASVHVRRSDWFGDAGAPPATQSLVYRLEHGANGWQVASMSRD